MHSGPIWKTFAVVMLATLLVAALMLGKQSRTWFNTLDLLATQARYTLRGPVAPADNLRVVGITEQTVSQFAGRGVYYPFPRDWHAAAVRRLADAGCRIIVLDILFSEADSWDDGEDIALGEAVAYAREQGCSVVLAAAVERTDLAEGVHSESLVTPAQKIMEGGPVLGLSNTREKLSYKVIEQVSLSLPLGPEGAEVDYYSQAAAAFKEYCGQEGRDFAAELDRAAVEFTDAATGSRQRVFRINYCAPPEQFPGHVYDYVRLFPEVWLAEDEGTDDGTTATHRELTADEAAGLRDIFAGTVVFIGSRSKPDNDYFHTPLGVMYGVDTNAQAFDTLARERLITSVPPTVVLAIIFALGLAAWGLSLIHPISKAVLLGLLAAVLLVTTNCCLFVLGGIELPLAATFAGLVVPLGAGIAYHGITEELDRRRIRQIFGRYVNDEIIDQIIDNPELAGLGGVEREVAVLFNDIRSYSTITEHMTPREIVSFLNIYLTEATDAIRANHGFVDKYLGDGLMAFFGGPVPTADPAGDAIRAALEIVRRLHDVVHPRLTELGAPAFKVGVGIHFGPAVMGNVGSETRHDYTLIGDAVNVAARVESQTKEFGWAVVVTRDVRDAVKTEFDYELVGSRRVKGRETPVEMYRVVDPARTDIYRLDAPAAPVAVPPPADNATPETRKEE